MSNRKLIRTTLAEVKGKVRETPYAPRERDPRERDLRERDPRERGNGHPHRGVSEGGGRPPQRSQHSAPSSIQARKRLSPPSETGAEIFYYKKQIDAHTPMVLVLQDGEEIEGTLEWYDRGALKVNRQDAPNLLILKRNVKYMFKADERVEDEEVHEVAAAS